MIAGIIGMPNVGKSTLFNLVTGAGARSSAFPYCTVEPNGGIAGLKDRRLDDLQQVFPQAKIGYPSLKFIDVAGLPPGASKGEGLGNKFLSNIRDADALVHVVRAFKDRSVSSFNGTDSTPQKDLELVNTELFLADLQIVSRRLKENPSSEYYLQAKENLEKQIPPPADSEGVLLTPKPQVVLVNMTSGAEVPEIKASRLIYIDLQLQSELQQMPQHERKEFTKEIPAVEVTVDDILFEVKELLGLVTFFTVVGGEEIKGYNVPEGTEIKKAAGKIHSDMEKGFIRARVFNYSQLKECSFSLEELKKRGRLRTEGKEYIVKEGDIIEILFS